MIWDENNTQDWPCHYDMDGQGTPLRDDDIVKLSHIGGLIDDLQAIEGEDLIVYLDNRLALEEAVEVLEDNGFNGISWKYTASGPPPPKEPDFDHCPVDPIYIGDGDPNSVAWAEGWQWFAKDEDGYLWRQDDASRYWVGGSGNYSDNTNHISASSGGAPGASKPTTGDDFFVDNGSDVASANFTITLDEDTDFLNSADINCTDAVATWDCNSNEINVTNEFLLTDGSLDLSDTPTHSIGRLNQASVSTITNSTGAIVEITGDSTGTGVNLDGTLSSNKTLGFLFTAGKDIIIDIDPSNPNTIGDVVINNGGFKVTNNNGQTFQSMTLIDGDFVWGSTTQPNNFEGSVDIQGTSDFGIAGMTVSVSIGGDFGGAGTYTHGNNTTALSGATNQNLSDTFTFFNLTVTTSSTNIFQNMGSSITVENTLSIATGAGTCYWNMVRGGTSGDSTLIIGTASFAGSINVGAGGVFRGHWSANSDNAIIQGANGNYYAELSGIGTFDWDYGTSNGEVRWKWLNMKGTNSSAKATGGNGVTIRQLSEVRFFEDFTVSSTDTLEGANFSVKAYKNITRIGTVTNNSELQLMGTGIINDWNPKNILIRTNSQYSFDGTADIGTDGIVWDGVNTGDFIAYDSSSVIENDGECEVPSGAYFGADSSSLLGDGSNVSTWSTDSKHGWFKNAGTSTFTTGKTSINGSDPGDARTMENTGTFNNNNGTVDFLGQASFHIIYGDITFHNLEITPQSVITTNYRFQQGFTYTVDGYAKINGSSTNPLVIQSQDNITQVDFRINDTQDFAYLTISDWDATNGSSVPHPAFSTNNGNNSGINFADTNEFVWDGGGSDELASTGDNWAGGVAPGLTDSMEFGDASDKDCTWDLLSTAGHPDILSTYAGDITLSSDVDWASLDFAGPGSLIVSTYEITINGTTNWDSGTMSITTGSYISNGDMVLDGGVFGANDEWTLDINGDIIITTTVFNCPSAPGFWTLEGNWTFVSGTFTNNNSVLICDGTLEQTLTTSDKYSLYRVTNSNTTANVVFSSDLELNGITFATGTTSEADNAQIKLTGGNPALNVGDPPTDRPSLISAGRIVETGTGVFIFGLTTLARTAVWKIAGSPSVVDVQETTLAYRKPGVRMATDVQSDLNNSGWMIYGASNTVSVGIQFRLEDCFGGHATKRVIVKKRSGTSTGWEMFYDVATAKIKLTVDDGVTEVTVDSALDANMFKWWTFTYEPGSSTGLKLYYGNTLQDTGDTTGLGSININGQLVLFGDATNTIAMMFGGFLLYRGVLSTSEIASINSKKDSSWVSDLSGILEAHIPGEQHDWGGAIGRDVDETTLIWKDVTGSNYYMSKAGGAGVLDMDHDTPRPNQTFGGSMDSLTYTKKGSVCLFDVSEDNPVAIGDAILLETSYRKWSGTVEKIKKGVGGTKIRAIGTNDDNIRDPFYSVFSDRETNFLDQTKDHTDMIAPAAEGSGDAGSAGARFTATDALRKDAFLHGYGIKGEWYSISSLQEATPLELVAGDFQILNREENMKDAASETEVIGYSKTRTVVKETSAASPITSHVLGSKPVDIIKCEMGGVNIAPTTRVDTENKTLNFASSTTDFVIIEYTTVDILTSTSKNKDFEEIMGKKKRKFVLNGYWQQSDLNTIADQKVKNTYNEIAIKPRTTKYIRTHFYVGMKIRINVSGDPFGINGYYTAQRVSFDKHLLSTPKLELEEYDVATGVKDPSRNRDLSDSFDRVMQAGEIGEKGLF